VELNYPIEQGFVQAAVTEQTVQTNSNRQFQCNSKDVVTGLNYPAVRDCLAAGFLFYWELVAVVVDSGVKKAPVGAVTINVFPFRFGTSIVNIFKACTFIKSLRLD